MMVRSEVLKACPHCGGEPKLLQDGYYEPANLDKYPERTRSWVVCSCDTHWKRNTAAEAIAAWNTRTTAVATDEGVARLFHETYERLAPQFSYETRKASAVPWEQVPENNRNLMIAVAAEVRAAISTCVSSTDEGVVERVARAIEPDAFDALGGQLSSALGEAARRKARAAINAIAQNTKGEEDEKTNSQ
jgi:hypothetical protein